MSAVHRGGGDHSHQFTRNEFINMVKGKDTIVDTLFILGPSNESKLAELAEGLGPANVNQVAQEINRQND